MYCGRQLSFFSGPWVECNIDCREQGRDLVFIMYLKSGKGKGEVHLFLNHYSMINIYFRLYIFLPKRFGAT